MRAYLVVYDIPAKSEVVNPSEKFKHHAVRINYSCWIVPEGRLALLPIDEMQAGGAKVEIVRFDEKEKDSLVRLAKNAMGEEASRMREALVHTTASAKKRFNIVKNSWSEEEFKKAGAYASVHMRRIQESIVAAEECALAFDLTGEMQELLNGLRKMYAIRQIEVTEACKAAEKKGVRS